MKYQWLVILLLICSPTSAQQLPLPPQPHIVVDGIGELERTPDIVELDLDIRHTANTFADAKKAADATVSSAIRAAMDLGVTADDINASQIQAAPQYEWRGQEKTYKGEQVSRQLHVRLNKPDNYNALVDALLASGVSRLQRANFSFSNQAQLEKLALQQALDNARDQAQHMAAHMKIKLGPIYQIAPSGPVAYPGGQLMEMADAVSESPSLKPGKQTIRQQIRVVYLLVNP